MPTNNDPYYDALKAIVSDMGTIDGHHDLHHDGRDWGGDTLDHALEMIQSYCPGISDDDKHELAQIYADGYAQARGDATLSRS